MLNEFLRQGIWGTPAISSQRDSVRRDGRRPGQGPRRNARRVRQDYIEDRLDKLLLVTRAMWELIRDQTSLTEEDLLAKVREIDLRDGRRRRGRSRRPS